MKKVLCLVLILFLMLFGLGCNKTVNDEMKLVIATMPSIDKVPMLVAMEKGFFKEYGLTVEIQNFQSPTDRDAALQSGHLDGIMSDLVADIFYLAAGQKLKVTSLVQTDFAIIASTSSSITRLADITSEHKNGIARSGIIEYIADQAGNAQKIALPSVMNRVEQVVSGAIDLTIVPEPYGSMAVARGAVKVSTSDQLGIYAAVMLFPQNVIDNKSAALTAFYKGYEDAVKYMATADPDEYIDAVISKGGFSDDAKAVLSATAFRPLKAPTEQQFIDIQNWMNDGDFSGPYSFNFSEICDFNFLAP